MLTSPKPTSQHSFPLSKAPPLQALSSLEQIGQLAGQRPPEWKKPAYNSFEYWLACNCHWLTQEEIQTDKQAYEKRSLRALQTSHRFKWDEEPRFEDPKETGEYTPEMDMKLIKDRNLTDSARRIAIFLMRHAYQDSRAGRILPITKTFIMKGLALSASTVKRSLTLLETRGYLSAEVTTNGKTRMCAGLLIHLKQTLMARHHQKKWPTKAIKPEGSPAPPNQIQNLILKAKYKFSRHEWAEKSMEGVYRAFMTSNIPPILA